ncbi:MAG: hypothetical protein M1830_008806 [Pleopsidium flavum]|nr:MAG: hypothetical protein M1830_008806 [Pleopsidium flavum]
MLGRLLHTAASSLNPNASSTRSYTSLQSVTEETHTHNLLFPDASLLQHSQNYAYPLHTTSPPTTAAAAGSFDNKGDWGIQCPQDIRIIIAQDAIGPSDQSTVLFDSKPPPARPLPPKPIVDAPTSTCTESQSLQPSTLSTSTAGDINARTSTPNRHATQRSAMPPRSPLAPKSPQTTMLPASQAYTESDGAIFRASLRGKSLTLPLTESESAQSRLASEAEDEQRSLVDCMFGVTVFSYKGPSTKLHVLSVGNGSGGCNMNMSPVIDRGHGQAERLEGPRRSQLKRSVTVGNFRSDLEPSSPTVSGSANTSTERSTVLVTRMFSVNLPDRSQPSEASHEQTPKVQDRLHCTKAYPFPPVGGSGPPKSKKVEQPKTPMYGIAMVLQLPVNHRGSSAPPSRSASQAFNFCNAQGSCTSSVESESRSGWPSLDSGLGPRVNFLTAALPSGFDERLDQLVQHWDVITRTISYLQSTASDKILALLKVERVVSPQPPVHFVSSELNVPGKESGWTRKIKVRGTNQPSLRLQADVLMENEDIQGEAKLAGIRIALGLKIPRVVTGQGRWGVWREEARWVGRWAGGKEQNFFFFNLLTAFLGNHTGWLSSLGPSWYKRRHCQQQRAHQSEQATIPSRTVIVSSDKMAARRLIFLLSAFLPTTDTPLGGASPQRPNSSTSSRAFSQSPPSGIPLLRQESLRRTMNRRARGNRSGGVDLRSHKRVTSFPSHDSTANAKFGADSVSFLTGQHSRRQSEVRSMNAASLPICSNGTATRKNSTAATSTAIPNKAVPIPHFTPHESEEQRPGSGSLASLTLRQTLNRSESTNLSNNSTESQPASRWGSLISGFWSNRRESSTDESDFMASSQEGLGITGIQGPDDLGAQSRHKSKLAKMADEVGRNDDGELYREEMEDINTRSSTTVQPSPEQALVSPEDWSPTPAKAIPERPRLCESPLKMSVDENDGVVDVDLPIPKTLSSSFGSHMSSPGRAHHISSSSLDAHGHSSSRMESEMAVNVAGWLKRYHDDFALQAVKPYADLVKEIKRSMKAEPTPTPTSVTPHEEGGPVERWVDVCTTLIADTNTFLITRLRLRRRVKLNPLPSVLASSEAAPSTPVQSQYGNPYTAAQLTPGFGTLDNNLEEDMVEEPIMDMDGTLIDAVERVLAQSGQSSKAHSRASSRSSSLRGRHEKRGSDVLPTLEVPRGECKRMVLGALEQVVKSVTDDRTLEEHGGRGRDIRGSSSTASLRSVPAESTLREGIRKWLHDVEVDP